MSCTAGATPAYVNLVPSIATGSSATTRVGNEIYVKSAKIRVAVNLLPYNVGTNPLVTPLYIRFVICANRSANTSTLSSTNVASSLFLAGANPVGTQGTALDAVLPINNDAWAVAVDKTVRLGVSYVNATGSASTADWCDNSMMSLIEEFDLSGLLGTLKYANNLNDPYNKNLFLIMMPSNADGTSGAGYVPAEYHFAFQVKYTDL